MNFYAEVSLTDIGLEDFCNYVGDVVIFCSKKERDEFVEDYDYRFNGKTTARKITRKRAYQLIGHREDNRVVTFIEEAYMGHGQYKEIKILRSVH